MATSKAKTKVTQGAAEAPVKTARTVAKSAAATRSVTSAAGSRNGVFVSPADLPLPIGYVAKVDLPSGYRPRADEEYMCAEHVEYFRRKLLIWRQELIEESQQHGKLRDERVSDLRAKSRRLSRKRRHN